MSYRRMWAALPAAALMSVVVLAAGCAAPATSATPGAPAVSQSGTGQGGTPTPGESAPAASASAQPGSPPPTQAPPGTPTPTAGGSDCANWPSSAPRGPLPLTFVPVEALRCVLGTRTVPGKGVYVTATLERATKDLGTLADALRRPSGHMMPGTFCPALAMLPPQLVLIAGNGAMISPRFPVDDCGLIQQEALSALNKLPWQVVSVRQLSQLPYGSVTDPAGLNPSDPVHGSTGGGMKGIPQAAANS